MEIITYCLIEDKNSDEFYRKLSNFTDTFINEIDNGIKQVIDRYIYYLREVEYEKLRGENEYLLEFLMIGVIWNNYISNAMSFETTFENIGEKLVILRKKGGVSKLVADFLRGIFSTVFLSRKKTSNIKVTLINMDKLIEWLKATGEFEQEISRLNGWMSYFGSISECEVNEIIRLSINFGLKFEEKSNLALGEYTENVDEFLEKHKKNYSWREDYILCGRKRNEYHFNMIGAEILNREYQDRFLNTNKEKLVLIPGCMRKNLHDNCKAQATENGLVCTKCTINCGVNHLVTIGEDYNFKVRIIPHTSDAFKKRDPETENIGMVGVSCVLNLVSGGLKAIELGFIPQCVFLDFCGCKGHWHHEGFSTSINNNRLMKILGV